MSLYDDTVTGGLFSWGDGDFGKLGRPADGSKVPRAVDCLGDVCVVRAWCGVHFSAALTVDGTLYTW